MAKNVIGRDPLFSGFSTLTEFRGTHAYRFVVVLEQDELDKLVLMYDRPERVGIFLDKRVVASNYRAVDEMVREIEDGK